MHDDPALAVPVDTGQVLATLRRLGKASTACIYRNHGVQDPVLGVPHGDLDKIARRLRSERALARALWDSGVHEARLLAARIEDPAPVPARTLDAWLGATSDDIVADAVAALAANRPELWPLAQRWIRSRREWTVAAGWAVVALLAMRQALDVAEADRLIHRIRRDIGRAKNRTRHSMNVALIAIGGSMPELIQNQTDSDRRGRGGADRGPRRGPPETGKGGDRTPTNRSRLSSV